MKKQRKQIHRNGEKKERAETLDIRRRLGLEEREKAALERELN